MKTADACVETPHEQTRVKPVHSDATLTKTSHVSTRTTPTPTLTRRFGRVRQRSLRMTGHHPTGHAVALTFTAARASRTVRVGPARHDLGALPVHALRATGTQVIIDARIAAAAATRARGAPTCTCATANAGGSTTGARASTRAVVATTRAVVATTRAVVATTRSATSTTIEAIIMSSVVAGIGVVLTA
jgi:hypothetical protein